MNLLEYFIRFFQLEGYFSFHFILCTFNYLRILHDDAIQFQFHPQLVLKFFSVGT